MNTIKPETTRNYTREHEIQLEEEIAQREAHLDFLRTHRAQLESLNLHLDSYANYVDFNRLDRPDVLRVIKAFPGRWNKSTGYDGRLNYTRLEPCGDLTLRLWGAEAPDCCHIEERIEYVDVPARTERRVTRVVKCPEPKQPVSPVDAEAVA